MFFFFFIFEIQLGKTTFLDEFPTNNLCLLLHSIERRSSDVVTLALGSRPRQRGCKGAGQEEAQEPRHIPGSVGKCEGVNPHTPKATPTLGDGVPVDSQNFRKRIEGSKLNGLWPSLYHWKDLGT